MRKLAWNLITSVVLSKHLIYFIYGVVNDAYRSESDIFADALCVCRYCGWQKSRGLTIFQLIESKSRDLKNYMPNH